MNVKTAVTTHQSPDKATPGNSICERKTLYFLCIILYILCQVFIGNRQRYYVNTSLRKSSVPANNTVVVATSSDEISEEVEQISREYPVWIDNRRSIDSNSRPYDWCVSEDVATNDDDSPKGLFFVKSKKSGSSTGAGVTLRIRDGLSRRLTHVNETASTNCFAHSRHSTARDLNYQKRDGLKSFLWSIVREPAQRTLSRENHTATEDSILKALKSSASQNFQSNYLDLPSEKLAPSTPAGRIINGYDFLAVNERMDESLVVLAMLARIPLADVVVFSSKIAGGYDDGGTGRCVKIVKKWTTPKIDEYIRDGYKIANRDDYLLYHTAQRSLDLTIDALGKQHVEKNVELLKRLQQQNEEQCANEVTWPCPEPEDEEEKREHKPSCKKELLLF